MIVSLNDVLKDNVVFQFNFHNLEFLKAILEVHYEENYPLILGISESGLNYMGEDFVFRSYFKSHKTGIFFGYDWWLKFRFGISVEGEIGQLESFDYLTDPKEAKEFVELTGVDALAISINISCFTWCFKCL